MSRQAISSARRGTVLILVLGLITLFMALLLSITVRVYNSGKTNENLRRHAQAHIMMQAAKIYIAESSPATWVVNAVTIGDTLPAASFPPQSVADRLGWARINKATPTDFNVIATGGGSATPGTGKTSLNSGSELANALDVRYLYSFVFTAPKTFDITVNPITGYSW